MKDSAEPRARRQAEHARDLFAELSEGMKALDEERLGKRTLRTVPLQPAIRERSSNDMREQLLSHLPWFVSAVTKLHGVRRIALLGSITTNKQNPKDIDFLVVVDDDVDLEPLARLGRKIKGRAQQTNQGADIFLTDTQGKYRGRTCSWKRCGPGIRRSCDALNCGKRHYLHDDLQTVSLSDETVRAALELWPSLERRVGLPDDLEETLNRLEVG